MLLEILKIIREKRLVEKKFHVYAVLLGNISPYNWQHLS